MDFTKLEQEALNGSAESSYKLAEYYLSGMESIRNKFKAIQCLFKAAEQGYADASVRLTQELSQLRQLAKEGNADAMDSLALCHCFGCGVPREYDEAERLWLRAIKLGSVSAAEHYADAELIGYFETVDFDKDAADIYREHAQKYFQYASSHGSKYAKKQLAQNVIDHVFGWNEVDNPVVLLEDALCDDSYDAYVYLGIVYMIGLTPYGNDLDKYSGWVPDDHEKAFLYLSKGAPFARRADGHVFLAHCYLYGIGTKQNSEKAYEEFSKARSMFPSQDEFFRLILDLGDMNPWISLLCNSEIAKMKASLPALPSDIGDETAAAQKYFRDATECIQSHAANSDVYDKEKSRLIDFFGNDKWNFLDEKTKKALISGKVFLTMLSWDTNSIMDYSGVCILFSSALETELKRVFFTNYLQFLERTVAKAFQPRSLFSSDDKSSPAQFTLGKMPYLFGARAEKGDKKDSNVKCMTQFLSSVLHPPFQSSELSAFRSERCQGYCSKCNSTKLCFIGRCETIRNDYRNESAHAGKSLSKKQANECQCQILGNDIRMRNTAERNFVNSTGLIAELLEKIDYRKIT